MRSPAELIADLIRFQRQRRDQRVQEAGLSNAGIARKGAELSGGKVGKRLQPRTGKRGAGKAAESGLTVYLHVFVSVARIRFRKDKYRLHASFYCKSGKLIKHEKIRLRSVDGRNDEQDVHVCHRRTDKDVLPGQDLYDDAFLSLRFDLYAVPCNGTAFFFSEYASGAAFINGFSGFNIVKAAERTNYQTFCSIIIQSVSLFS